MKDDFSLEPDETNNQPPEPSSHQLEPITTDPGFITLLWTLGLAFLVTGGLQMVGYLLHSRTLVYFCQLLLDTGALDTRLFGGDLWRPFTHIFLHADLGHLVGNLICLLPLAAVVRHWTPWWLGAFIACGIAGGLLQIIVHPSTSVIGASGGISGLAGVGIVSAWRLVSSGKRLSLALPVLLLIAVFIYQQFVGALSGQAQNVAHMAHLGGLLAGLFLGKLVPLRNP